MGISCLLATVVVLCSVYGSSSIRTSTSPVPSPPSEKLLNRDVTDNESYDRLMYVAGNCGRLVVRNGLEVGETVKVTSNGWTDEDEDFIVNLISTEDAEPRLLDESGASKEGTRAAGNGGVGGTAAPETAPVAYVGVMISQPTDVDEGKAEGETDTSSGEGTEHGGEEVGHLAIIRPPRAAVLVYEDDPSNPTYEPIDTPAGPQTPFMITFKKLSSSSLEVAVYAWTRGEGETKKHAYGTWHEVRKVVRIVDTKKDLSVAVSNCQPRVLKLYASASAEIQTAKAGTCNDKASPLVEVYPAPGQAPPGNEAPPVSVVTPLEGEVVPPEGEVVVPPEGEAPGSEVPSESEIPPEAEVSPPASQGTQ